MNNFKIILILSFGITMAACKKASYQLYESTNRIQFGPTKNLIYNQGSTFQDSLKMHTFAYLENSKLSDTVYFDIYTQGEVMSTDRPFKLVQEMVEGEQNALPDVHYRSFENANGNDLLVIKGGQIHNRVPVILYRDSSLRDLSVVLKIVVRENEHFKPGQKELIWRKLIFTDKLNRPASWNVGMLGKYSEVKHRHMISSTQQKWDDAFIANLSRDVQAQHYWMGLVKKALKDYNNQNPLNPLIDEDLEIVIFP